MPIGPRYRRTFPVLLVLLTVFSFAAPVACAAEDITAVKARRMLDVNTGKWLEQPVVLIRGERIDAVGSWLAIPAGAKVIDLGNAALLPGLMDMHTHITGNPDGRLKMV